MQGLIKGFHQRTVISSSPSKYLLFACVLLPLAAKSSTAIAAATAPVITTQPVNAAVKKSATATFTVVASGTGPLKYQWYRNNTEINGATLATYKTPPTTDADNYSSFYVIVSNSAGSVNSNTVVLFVVDNPPVIEQQPSNATVTVPGIANFSVYASSEGPLSYQWYKNGAAISGATDYIYIVLESSTADNGAVFTVAVKNVAGTVKSGGAKLTVDAGTTETFPIAGNWSGTATITTPGSAKLTYPAVAAFSQTPYSITGAIVFTDENGIANPGIAVASLNGLNIFTTTDGGTNIAGGFSSNLLTLTISASYTSDTDFGDSPTGTGSGTLTLSADHQKLTGSGTDSDGDAVTWTLTRD